jgi:hypothetical protein
LGGELFQIAPNNNYDAHITACALLLDFGSYATKLAEAQCNNGGHGLTAATWRLVQRRAGKAYNIPGEH